MTIDIIALLITAISVIFLCVTFAGKKAVMYLKLYLAAAGCYALGKLFMAALYFSSGSIPAGFSLGYLGLIGCFAFLASSNYGVINGVIDDGGKRFRRYRLLSAAAPAVDLMILIPAFIIEPSMELKVTILILGAVIAIASYYSLKEVIFPDMDFEFLRIIRPCNIIVIMICFFTSLQILATSCVNETFIEAMNMVNAVLFVLMAFAVNRGRKLWTL